MPPTIADLCFDFSWLLKARRVVSSGIAVSPSVIICLKSQPFLRRTLTAGGAKANLKCTPQKIGKFFFSFVKFICKHSYYFVKVDIREILTIFWVCAVGGCFTRINQPIVCLRSVPKIYYTLIICRSILVFQILSTKNRIYTTSAACVDVPANLFYHLPVSHIPLDRT